MGSSDPTVTSSTPTCLRWTINPITLATGCFVANEYERNSGTGTTTQMYFKFKGGVWTDQNVIIIGASKRYYIEVNIDCMYYNACNNVCCSSKDCN